MFCVVGVGFAVRGFGFLGAFRGPSCLWLCVVFVVLVLCLVASLTLALVRDFGFPPRPSVLFGLPELRGARLRLFCFLFCRR